MGDTRSTLVRQGLEAALVLHCTQKVATAEQDRGRSKCRLGLAILQRLAGSNLLSSMERGLLAEKVGRDTQRVGMAGLAEQGEMAWG